MVKASCDPCPLCGAPQCEAVRLPLLAVIIRCGSQCPLAGPVIHCRCQRACQTPTTDTPLAHHI